ncbi:MAG TPA: cytochrome o ubiquinol oxidase subunit IV [Candidatus Saccharimonadales bacterium]|nr:cytochrome o ubiquinol oxidase subunit IV [Candidatus Saccharimonadales bacterium]
MNKATNIIIAEHDIGHGTFKTYVSGYIASLILTLTAYLIITHRAFGTVSYLVISVAVLAITQFIVQLYYFLRLGTESNPQWKLLVFGFMFGVVFILVFGSLWIMSNLNYRMTPEQINNYMLKQDGGI